MPLQKNLEKVLQHPERLVKKFNRLAKHAWEDWQKVVQHQFQESAIVNQKEIRVLGLMRTGNHAVINWLRSQQTGVVLNLNNLIPDENPYRYKYTHLKDHYPQHGQRIEFYRKEAEESLTPKDCLLYSYEDYEISQVVTDFFEKRHDIYLGRSEKRYDLLIIRDPFNLFASRLKNNYLTVKSKSKDMVGLWLDYAKEYLGETQILNQNKVCVNYNQWSQDQDYRRMIAQQTNTIFTDEGFDKVSNHGGGSSFDQQEFNGQASQMDTLNRWKLMLEDENYRQLFKNEELWDYSEKIFGYISGTELLRN